MSAQQLQHRRTHNLLLISKLLNGRDNASPFTLVVDSLEQSGRPLVREIIKRARNAKTKVIYVSFETSKQPRDIDVFLLGNEVSLATLQKRILEAVDSSRKNVLVFDTLHPHLQPPNSDVSAFLSSFMSPLTSIVAVYHSDMPLSVHPKSIYQPPPQKLLRYLATTIFSVHSFAHVLAQKAAKSRSLAEPMFGLAEEVEGILTGLESNDKRGIVIEMEYRRKSGRAVKEWFFLSSHAANDDRYKVSSPVSSKTKELVILLEDHPLYSSESDGGSTGTKEEAGDITFDLGLTEKQRRARDDVILPYFDAQSGQGPGEGGRILYDMGVEDDFDDEEDEV